MNRKRLLAGGVALALAAPLLLSCDDTTRPEVTAVILTVTATPSLPPGQIILHATLTNTGTTRVVAYGPCQAIRFAMWGAEGTIYYESPCVAAAVICAPSDHILDPGETYEQEFAYSGVAWTLEFQDAVAECEANLLEPGSYHVRGSVNFRREGSEAYYTLLSEPTNFEWNGAAR
jgi:hypothetical protein